MVKSWQRFYTKCFNEILLSQFGCIVEVTCFLARIYKTESDTRNVRMHTLAMSTNVSLNYENKFNKRGLQELLIHNPIFLK